jgi:hypothetical protein
VITTTYKPFLLLSDNKDINSERTITDMINLLHGASKEWIGDGKASASLQSQGNVLTIFGGQHGTPFNLRLDMSTPLQDYYFEVHIEENPISYVEEKKLFQLSIGVVTEKEFHSGWGTKGMFYNGNLTNGSAALSTNWGPRFGIGDSIGARVLTTQENVEVVFYKNGKSLGTGFLVENQGKSFVPCISIDGDAKLRIEFPSDLPEKELVVTEDLAMFGRWKLIEAAGDGGTQLCLPRSNVVMELIRERDVIKFSAKVGNPISGTAKILVDNGNTLTIKMGNAVSGRMMPPPVYREIESLICNMGANTLTLENGKLIFWNVPKRTVWIKDPRNPLALPSY